MHICLAAAHAPGLCSKFGGGGDAGTSEHQFGFSGGAEVFVGCFGFGGVRPSASSARPHLSMHLSQKGRSNARPAVAAVSLAILELTNCDQVWAEMSHFGGACGGQMFAKSYACAVALTKKSPLIVTTITI